MKKITSYDWRVILVTAAIDTAFVLIQYGVKSAIDYFKEQKHNSTNK
jgi:hypothetical protein